MRHDQMRQGTALAAKNLSCGELLHTYNYLGLPEAPSRPQVWLAAQKVTLLFANFCRVRGLPPDATALIFGVHRFCETHEQAALLSASNLVEAYTTHSHYLEVEK